MRKSTVLIRALTLSILSGFITLCTNVALADGTRQVSATKHDPLWRKSLNLAEGGSFLEASETIDLLPPAAPLVEQVRHWLDDFAAEQTKRKELDREDFDRYVKYAKQRIERKEYTKALSWVMRATECTTDKEALLKENWVQDLVDVSLSETRKLRKDQKWEKAWGYYWRLGDLFEKEPRYLKLQREAVTHLRLEAMFKKDSKWEERVEQVNWETVERALEYIERLYVEVADFKAMTESGIEQLLLLADSHSAQKQFERLGNEADRQDFTARLHAVLDQIREAPSLTRREATAYFRRIIKRTNRETVRLPEEVLVSELVRGAFEPLDDFTTIIWPDASEQFEKHTRGDYIGVGISIVANRDTEEIEVVTPLEGTPAYYAGVMAGDIITHVDGKPIKGLSTNKVVNVIMGAEGSVVNLTIRRGGETVKFALTRSRVKLYSVKGYTRDPGNEEKWNYWLDKQQGVAYIRITSFQANTPEDVINALSELEANGLRALVMDLRDNPGGLLDAAYGVSRLFLDDGEMVVSTKGRNPSENQELYVRTDGPWSTLPVVVLVNGSSASASEIVSGAIRDTKHGIVVGERTYGKFSVQNLIPLGQRSGAKLKLTVAKYFLPSGVSLHHNPGAATWGVEPNISVPLVAWERTNVWKFRNERESLASQKLNKANKEKEAKEKKEAKEAAEAELHGDDEKSLDADKDDTKSKEGNNDPLGETAEPADADAKLVDGEKSEEPELPKLDQPDENNRPMADPQLDAALLVMRIKLMGQQFPSLAAAQSYDPKTAKP